METKIKQKRNFMIFVFLADFSKLILSTEVTLNKWIVNVTEKDSFYNTTIQIERQNSRNIHKPE